MKATHLQYIDSKRLRPCLIEMLNRATVLAAALAAGGLVPAALAQETGAARGEHVLEEIVVTAERRERDLQEVPIAITAFTGKELNTSAIQSTIDLQYNTPGMVFTTNSVLGQPYIRGIGTDVISAGADASIATHVDGVYHPRAVGALQDFYDLERVEVLKGPQGTLYGRNATGGAVNYISNKPQPEFGLNANFTYGNFDKIRFAGALNVPIVEDRVLARIAGVTNDRDGFRKNLLNAPSAASGFDNTTQDGEGVWAVRGHLQFNLSDNLELLISGDYLEERSSRSLGPSPNPDLPSPAMTVFGGIITGSTKTVLFDVPSFAEVDAWGVHGKLAWDLGPVTITSLTSYGETHFFEELDIDATSADFLFNKPFEDSEIFTQEITIASNIEGRLEWVAGAFYLQEDAGQFWDIGGGLFDATVFPGFALNPAGVVDVEAWALFGQGTYSFTDQWRFTAGVRYSEEKKSHVFIDAFATTADAVRAGAPCGPPFCAETPDKDKWTAWTPRFGVEYLPSADIMAYATVTRGFKSGGFNSVDGSKVAPEFLWNYELGLKATWLDDRLRTNVSAFFYDYTDIQVQVAVPGAAGAVNRLENAASAEVFGAELELLARPAQGWDLSFAVAWLDAEYTDYCTVDPDNPGILDASCGLDAIGNLVNQDLSGSSMPRAPKWGLTGSAQYSWPLAAHGDVFVRGEWRYQSNVFFDQFANEGVNQPGYHLANARLQFDSADGRWYIAMWGKNLFDETFKQSVIRNTAIIGSLDFFGPRRTYGLQVGFKY